ncbi:MAG TPA: hypothetical protein VHD36_04460 [Pirellulales bacterium]|nr:hypothetical protein [Pirellulales bacterium]
MLSGNKDSKMGKARFATLATMLTLAWSIVLWADTSSAETRVMFDMPDSIECRDVTPEKCAAAHPNLKAIEGKFRLSARITRGSETDVVDFLYMLISPSLRLKIHDYLPNTTLESALSGDNIEVAETTENTTGNTQDAHIGYKIFNLGASRNQTAKTTEQNHYKQIVPKALVLASGTTNREHGVFFKLRPSNGQSLEGAKEFTFLAIVPKSWRGDWCTITCAARAQKKSFLPTSVTLAGIEQAHIGLYLSGDREANALAEQLCQIQETNSALLDKELKQEAGRLLESMHDATAASPQEDFDNWLHSIFRSKGASDEIEHVKKSMTDVQDQLSRLAGSDGGPGEDAKPGAATAIRASFDGILK